MRTYYRTIQYNVFNYQQQEAYHNPTKNIISTLTKYADHGTLYQLSIWTYLQLLTKIKSKHFSGKILLLRLTHINFTTSVHVVPVSTFFFHEL